MQTASIRDLPETLPAFDNLEQFLMPMKTEEGRDLWASVREGYTCPLLFTHYVYATKKPTIKNLLVQRFLPDYGYTLKRVVDTKVSRQVEYWIEVNELNDVVFHVFNFRHGGVGVAVARKDGSEGMLEMIKRSEKESEALDKKKKMLDSIKAKLTPEEIAFLRI